MTPQEPIPPTSADSTEREDVALDRRILRASTWVAASVGGRQVVSFVSTLVLLRLLEPQDFGLVALALSVLSFVQVVQESGVGAALVHRRTDIERAATCSFVFAGASSIVLYGVAFAAAPLAGAALDQSRLTDVVRVLAVLLLVRGVGVVPSALLERQLAFRVRTISDMAAAAAQAGVAIGLALAGAGVWALVLGQVAGGSAATAVFWLLVPWRPRLRNFDRRILRELLRYGRFISASNVLMIISHSIDNVVVARLLGATRLGYYSVAWRICELPVLLIGTIVGRVMFPVYAGLQHDLRATRRSYIQNLQRMALFALPVTIGIASATEPFVRVVMGDRWLPSVNVIRLLTIFAVLLSLLGPTSELFKGAGKPHLNLIGGILYPCLALPSLLVATRLYGIVGAASAVVVSMSLTGAVILTLSSRLLELRLSKLFRALAPSVLCTALMAAAMVASVHVTSSSSPVVALVSAIAIGAVVYIAATAVFARGIVLTMWHAYRAPEEQSSVASV